MGRLRVLAADDEPALRALVLQTLAQDHHTVDTCADGAEALRLFEAAPYDLLVLDVMMPRMTGVEVVRTIRSRGILTPVVLTSSLLPEDILDATETFESMTFLPKPFSLGELRAAVARVTGTVPNGNS